VGERGSGDVNGDGTIGIEEIITAVNVLLEGCPSAASRQRRTRAAVSAVIARSRP
jgi:hypothetical protein